MLNQHMCFIMQKFKIFYWGLLISFLGSLPLGTINVTATNIAVKNGTYTATLFAFGALFTETVCLCIALSAMAWVRKQEKVFLVFEWFTALLILVLAVSSFTAAWQMKPFGNNAFTGYHINSFLLGALISALNPLHIPFWIGWTTVLINKNIIQQGLKNYIVYIAGISTGTVLGFDVFIYGGNYIVTQLREKQNIVNWVIGLVLLVTAIVQLYKIKNKMTAKSIIADV